MEFYHYSPSETLVLTADQFVGRDDGALEQISLRWPTHMITETKLSYSFES